MKIHGRMAGSPFAKLNPAGPLLRVRERGDFRRTQRMAKQQEITDRSLEIPVVRVRVAAEVEVAVEG